MTKHAPDLRDIVVFGSICSVYRIQARTRSRSARKSARSSGKATRPRAFPSSFIRRTRSRSRSMRATSKRSAQSRTVSCSARSSTKTERWWSQQQQQQRAKRRRPLTKTHHRRYAAARRKQNRGRARRNQARTGGRRSGGVTSRRQRGGSCVRVRSQELRGSATQHQTRRLRTGHARRAPSPRRQRRVIKRPPGSNTLHTKWVFKTKTDAHGEIERLKARLVACGNEQVFGVDY